MRVNQGEEDNMVNKENQVLPMDDALRNLLSLALEKYLREIEEQILVQKSQFKAALFVERKAQIQRAIRSINPPNKDLLPSLTKNKQEQGEYHESRCRKECILGYK